MKNQIKSLILIALCITSTNLLSQLSFSCNYKEVCKWDNYKKEYNNCNGYEYNSLFRVNKAETMFVHTTEEMTSSYYVKSSQYNEEYDVHNFFVTSDVGNEYLYIFDLKNKEIRVLSTNNGEVGLIRFYVKSMF